jgi:hypothetical protein
MKTEGLTWAEAIRAYADGKRVKDVHGGEFFIEDEMPCCAKTFKYIMPNHYAEPFSIVQPPVKTLSFDEAIKCEEIKIEGPHPIRLKKPFFAEHFCAIDLAERRGWAITEVTE